MNHQAPSSKKQNEIQRRLESLVINTNDIEESFVSGSGKGGQKINKARNAVRLIHKPTGISIKVHESRSLEVNRLIAKRKLCDRLEALQKPLKSSPARDDSKNHNWFPGHMAKAIRHLKESLSEVTVIIEVRDARAPISTTNPAFDFLFAHKRRIILLNKIDLANASITNEWVTIIKRTTSCEVYPLNSLNETTRNFIINLINSKGDDKEGYAIESAMVIGVPNCGKSSLINRIANKKAARVENKPSVTKKQQWVPINNRLTLLDNPGILWPKIEDNETAYKLFLVKAIKADRVDAEDVICWFIPYLQKNYITELQNRYSLTLTESSPLLEVLEIIGTKKGFKSKGGDIDYEKTYGGIIQDFQSGKLGQISLEHPNKEV